ncbi:endo-beta-N-acetylglucosaminidase [Vibrio mediterranei]|uniref:Cytosolic endo-beta-N-acetylglucosaminidase TIM barrel domain-containing protein n=1 Tax=Vibrio mediterranei TaxID=689 RepID=A0AAN1FLX6_9VIBR|nr:hypothetical protein [Vibrio mediterranei]ASI93053.1 hypothetical protein BSZ05_25205 [Vibrio mediterranei]
MLKKNHKKQCVLISLFFICLAPFSKAETLNKKTYTWFLNKPTDSTSEITRIQDWDVSASYEGYLNKSVTPLNTSRSYQWTDSDHGGTNHRYSLIVRNRGTVISIPSDPQTDVSGFRFQHWAYIDKYIFFGGSYSEGTILAPDPFLIDQAHSNGVKIYGTVFLPEGNHGGQIEDAEALIVDDFSVMNKLTQIAKDLNFDGWFINLESPWHHSPARTEVIRRSLKDYLENTDHEGVEYIPYIPRTDSPMGGLPNSITDNNIDNAASIYGHSGYELNYWEVNNKFDTKKQYLMFIDEPVWRLLGGGESAHIENNCLEAYNSISELFLSGNQGSSTWKGLKYFTKKRVIVGGTLPLLPYCLEDVKGGLFNIAPFGRVSLSGDHIGKMIDDKSDNTHDYVDLGAGVQNVQLDLGQSVPIYGIDVWRYFDDNRKYNNVVITISESPSFEEQFVVFNNDNENIHNLGYGSDMVYSETASGKRIDVSGKKARYINFYSNGSNKNPSNHIVEAKVYTKRIELSEFSKIKKTNILKGRSSEERHYQYLQYMTDGDSSNSQQFTVLPDGKQYVTFDLGSVKPLTSLNIRHYYFDGRTYNDVIVETSMNPYFINGETTILYNNDIDGSYGLGVGDDEAYSETSTGLLVNGRNIPTRYIRLHSNGSNVNLGNHYVEIEAFVTPTLSTFNAAKGKLVSTIETSVNLERITDGIWNSTHAYADLQAGLASIEIDLEKVESVKGVKTWRYFGDGRVYKDIVIQLLDEKHDVLKTLFNNDQDSSSIFGPGNDNEYSERDLGYWVGTNENNIDARYIKLSSQGSSTNEGNHYVEVEVDAILTTDNF